ncbi:MAG: lamin tail domain-containing protein [Patescibacteria group bacterium]
MISEVQITGGDGKTKNEFIEIYNPNNFQVNLDGYRLVKRKKADIVDSHIKSWGSDASIPANSYYLWANSYYTNISTTPDATTTVSISSNDNGIAIRFGSKDTGIIIDSVAWGGTQNTFVEGFICSTTPSANQSLERKLNLDTNNNSIDFFIQENPNPQNSSATTTPPPLIEQPIILPGASSTNNKEATSTLTAIAQTIYKLGDVLINEFVSDPADNEVEWVELYNKIGKEIDLTGWWIEEGSKAKTKLEGIIGVSELNRYKVFEKPAGNLNNDGDIIILYDLGGKIIDQAAYGDWNDGDKSNNAPVARDPFSVARKFDGYNTYNNLNDFSVTIKPTKNASNIIQAEDEVSMEAKAKFDFSNDIFISEILPNPVGDDTKLEFIEIYNAGSRDVNLTGWSLSNKDNRKINFEKIATSTMIKAGEYLSFFRPLTKIVSHNDQGQIKLFQPLADKPIQTVKYKNVKEGWSYNLNENPSTPLYQGGEKEWGWSETPTQGAMNVFKIINHAPEVDFNMPKEVLIKTPVIFDSSDTDDQDGDSLKFNWDFGDGFKNNLVNPEHTYLKIGIYKVKLEVSDGKDKAEKIKSVKVVGSVDELSMNEQTPLPPLSVGKFKPLSEEIIINEIFPNPKGIDENNEWLELKNKSSDKINLKNWQIENSNGKYKFKNDSWIDMENFYLLTNKESKLAFKNTSDVISLYNDNDGLVDQAKYTEAIQDEAYARGENEKWFWTTAKTPEAENIINVAKSQYGIENQAAGIKISKNNKNNIIVTTLEKISQCEIGDLLKVKGKVAVLPGVLGTQYFYIVGSPGLQIYNYKKEFPSLLKVGDYVEVAGELSEINGQARLKTKDLADVKIIEHQVAPIAKVLNSDQFSEEYLGQLVSITGEVTDRKSSTVYLDDGNDEIEVYIKQATGIKPSSVEKGKTYAITGIVAKTQSGLKLMPRSNDDVIIQNQVADVGKVLGEVAVNNEWEVASRNKKLELFKYLLIIAIGTIILLIGLMIKKNIFNSRSH